MYDIDDPTLPPLRALRALRRRGKMAAARAAEPIQPRCRLRSAEGMARIAREIAQEKREAARAITYGDPNPSLPPPLVLYVLRRPRWLHLQLLRHKQRRREVEIERARALL